MYNKSQFILLENQMCMYICKHAHKVKYYLTKMLTLNEIWDYFCIFILISL